IDYGLGTRIGSYHGHRVFGHTGGGGGFNTILEDFPDDHLTIVVLTNTRSGQRVAAPVARAALGLPEAALGDVPRSKEFAAALPGVFDSDEGPVEQLVRDGRLRFRIPGKREEFPILREPDGTFAIDDTEEVRYLIRGGKAAWAFVYTAGLLIDAKPRTSQ